MNNVSDSIVKDSIVKDLSSNNEQTHTEKVSLDDNSQKSSDESTQNQGTTLESVSSDMQAKVNDSQAIESTLPETGTYNSAILGSGVSVVSSLMLITVLLYAKINKIFG